MALAKVSLDDKYALDTTRAYITGIEALVRLPILQHQRDVEAGLNTAGFISGYRGSPLGGLDQSLWKAKPYLEKHHIHFQPGVNEDLAATSVWGSQQVPIFDGAKYDGVFGMWYGKGPGVDRSMDAIRHANAFGTSKYGGVLAIAGDDHACKSSTLPHQTEHMFIGASIPILNPANVQEVLDLGIYGWELSRYSGCWVALKAITENMDSAISAEIDPHRVNIVIPDDFELPADGVHARWPDNPQGPPKRRVRLPSGAKDTSSLAWPSYTWTLRSLSITSPAMLPRMASSGVESAPNSCSSSKRIGSETESQSPLSGFST